MDSSSQCNVFLVTGDDAASIEAEAAAIVARVAGPNPDPFTLDVFREREGGDRPDLLRQLLRAVLSPPFLGNRKTVWLKDYSGFGSETGAATGKSPEDAALRELAQRVAAGIPADVVLVLDGAGADPRKPLAKACEAHGRLLVCSRPVLRQRNWQEGMQELIARRAAEKGARLSPAALDYLVSALGTDTGRIQGELEKLICYVGGPEQPIGVEAAEAVCASQGEEMPWALSNALGKRSLEDSLHAIRVLVEQGRDEGQVARSLLGQAAKYCREVLQVKVFMAEHGVRSPGALPGALADLTPEERERCLEGGLTALSSSPYRCKALAVDGEHYTGPELIEAIRAIHDAYLRCITSGVPERAALEAVVARVASPVVQAPARRR